MKLKLLFASVFFLSLFFVLVIPNKALADNVTLSGNVQDTSGHAIGATVTVNDPNNDSTTSDPTTGSYGLSIPSGTYNVQVTPQSGSGFSSSVDLNQNISSNTTLNFILVSSDSVVISGHLFDESGDPLPNQQVTLNLSTGGQVSTVATDSTGKYSFEVSPNSYKLSITGNNSNASLDVPEGYSFSLPNTSYMQSVMQDIIVPARKVSLHVQDSSGTAVSGVNLKTTGGNVGEQNIPIGGGVTVFGLNAYLTNGVTTDSSGNATMWLFPGSNAYTIVANPPSGSDYTQTISTNNVISGDTNLPITLQQSITISGSLYDNSGDPLINQQVTLTLAGGGQVGTVTTNASGNYSFQTSPGSYQIGIGGNNNNGTLNVPESYGFSLPTTSYTQNTTQNITVPANKVTLHVQNNLGQSVNDVLLKNSGGNVGEQNIPIGGGITVLGLNGFFTNGKTTDSSGDAIVWLFPGSNPYTVAATPPSGSIYSTLTFNITVSGDQTQIVDLQYNHATPVTTATFSPTSFTDGTYADPTTVTLSATAASGFTIANTFYKIDSGSPQTYTTPFSVTGAGSHTITYWSVDNSGVTEATNTKTFTITESYSLTGKVYNDSNQDGVQDDGEVGYNGATVTLNTGQSTTTDSNGNYTFSNLESGTYIETLTVPSGYFATTTNPADVALSANTTQNFGIAQASSLVTAINAGGDTEGSFAADADFSGGSTFSSGSTVDTSGVTNPAPHAVYQTVRFGNFTYTVPNLTPNTAYTLRLHFNEVYFGANGNSGGVGSRVFNVSVNGTNALSNFDIYQAAGGANKAVVEELPATSDSSGNITVQFSSVVDNAMVNGIEVDSGSPASTPTPTPTPITSEAINAGGDTQGSFVSDIDSTGGSTFTTTADVDTTGVTNPAPESVYQSVRYGNFTYDLTNFAPNSSHTVRLHFSEPYWGTSLSSNQGGDGSRVFNVSINGTQVLTNFDVYQTAGGADKAVIEEFPVSADANGKISIQFTTVTDNAMVSGIEVN